MEGVPEGDTKFKDGDEVFGCNWGFGNHGNSADEFPRGGAFSEFILVPNDCVSLKPAGVSHASAAACSLVGITAWQALDCAEVGPSSRLLVLGGTREICVF